jgi:solute carrier family 35 protein E1
MCYYPGSAASVETIKAAEPLSTVFIGLLIMRESYSSSTYLSLLPICGGIALTCYNFEGLGTLEFLFAMGSNFCFSARAVFAKMVNVSVGAGSGFDEMNLFRVISVIGLMMLIPICFLQERNAIQAFFSSALSSNSGELAEVTSLGTFSGLLVLNGVMFAAYNLASYLVLKRTELVTHSVLNVFRRVFVIVFTAFYFGTRPSVWALVGISSAIAGVALFGHSRRVETKNIDN